MVYWGDEAQPGSLANLRAYINRTLVDKAGKTFSVGDEFVVHAFRAHLIAAACTHLGVNSPTELVPHEQSQEWLVGTAKAIVEKEVMPRESKDHIYAHHRSFLHCGFLYTDLRNSIRQEEGEHIVRAWKHWAILFLGTNRKNYYNEAFNLICNLQATFPEHVAYIAMHNRTVNIEGKPGHGKPIDQMLEHYNL